MSTYYDRYVVQSGQTLPQQPSWQRLWFNPNVPVQSAELNELQSIVYRRILLAINAIFNQGALLTNPNPTLSGTTVTLSPCVCVINGIPQDVPGGTVNITGSGTETIGIMATDTYLTASSTPILNDPATGTPAFGLAGADREALTTQWVLNGTPGTNQYWIPLYTYVNGSLTTNPYQSLSNLYTTLAQLLRTTSLPASAINYTPPTTPQDLAGTSTLDVFLNNVDTKRQPSAFNLTGLDANKPTTNVLPGTLYFAVDTLDVYYNSGTYSTPSWNVMATANHSNLTNLSHNDHPQYLLRTDLSIQVGSLQNGQSVNPPTGFTTSQGLYLATGPVSFSPTGNLNQNWTIWQIFCSFGPNNYYPSNASNQITAIVNVGTGDPHPITSGYIAIFSNNL